MKLLEKSLGASSVLVLTEHGIPKIKCMWFCFKIGTTAGLMFIQETSLGIVSILVYTFLKETKAFSIRELVLYKNTHISVFCLKGTSNLHFSAWILVALKYNYNSYLFWMKTLIAGWFTGDSYLFLDLNFDTPSPTKNKPICRKHGKLRWLLWHITKVNKIL